MKDFVVVILLNYNQNDYTLKCVDSLLSSDYENYKIMLIDNGSTKVNADELEAALPNHEKLIYKRIENNIGYPSGANFALKEGMKLRPDYFLIMNNDTIIDENAIGELVKTSKEYNDKARVIGKVYHYNEPNTLQIVGNKFTNKRMLVYETMGVDEVDKGQYDKVEERDMIDDIYVLQPVSLYEKIGGYSLYFWMNGVEKDLSLRTLENGYKLVFTPYAKLWHKGSVSLGGRGTTNPKLAYWNIQSKLILRYLHINKLYFFKFYLSVLLSVISTSIKALYLKLFQKKDITKYAKAKYAGLVYFNKWVFKRNNNDGRTPL